MPMLALNGVTVPIRADPIEAEVQQFGDEADAWDGTGLTRVRARKRIWEIETQWMSVASAATVRAQIVAVPPVSATGDLTGSLSVIAKLTAERTATVGGLVRMKAFVFLVREI